MVLNTGVPRFLSAIVCFGVSFSADAGRNQSVSEEGAGGAEGERLGERLKCEVEDDVMCLLWAMIARFFVTALRPIY